MQLTIDDAILEKHNVSLSSFLLMLSVKIGTDLSKEFKELVENNIVLKTLDDSFVLSDSACEEVESILFESDKTLPKQAEVEKLALKLMAIVPQCKMPGTPYYYKCNKREVSNRLLKFYKLYGKYSDEQIIAATKKYVEDFGGDYTYMKLLKYFILKEDSSTLATILENKDNKSSSQPLGIRFV